MPLRDYSIRFTLKQQTPLLIKNYLFDNFTRPSKQHYHLANSSVIPALNKYLLKKGMGKMAGANNTFDLRMIITCGDLSKDKIIVESIFTNQHTHEKNYIKIFGDYFGYWYADGLQCIIISQNKELISFLKNDSNLLKFFIENRFYAKTGKGYGQFLVETIDGQVANNDFSSYLEKLKEENYVLQKDLFFLDDFEDNFQSNAKYLTWKPSYLQNYKLFKSGLGNGDHSLLGTKVYDTVKWEKRALKQEFDQIKFVDGTTLLDELFYKREYLKDRDREEDSRRSSFVRPIAGFFDHLEFMVKDPNSPSKPARGEMNLRINIKSSSDIKRFPSLIQFRVFNNKTWLIIPRITNKKLARISNEQFAFSAVYDKLIYADGDSSYPLFKTSNGYLITPSYSEEQLVKMVNQFISIPVAKWKEKVEPDTNRWTEM